MDTEIVKNRAIPQQKIQRSSGEPGSSIEIDYYADRDDLKWNNFLLNQNNASVFHQIEWKGVIEKSFGHKPHYIIASQSGVIKGILPLFEVKSLLFGHALVSIPAVVYGGVCSVNQETECMLYQSAAELGRLIGVDYVEMRNQFQPLSHFPCFSEKNISTYPDQVVKRQGLQKWITKDLYVSFEREIYEDEEKNFKAIPRKQRRMIRQGIQAGLESSVGGEDYLKEFYKLYAVNLKKLGTPVFPYEFFRNIFQAFPDTFILAVRKDGEMAAAVMTFVFKDRIIPYFSGSLQSYNRFAVNDFMYWELMKYGCSKGYKIFDYGRSKKNTGSYHFKRHWGFAPRSLPFLYCLVLRTTMPEVNPSNPKYRAIIQTWRRLPLSVTKWLGPVLNRRIP